MKDMANNTPTPTAKPERTHEQKSARTASLPSANATLVMHSYDATGLLGQNTFSALVEELNVHVRDVWNGDLRRAEGMLLLQAHALQSMFTQLTIRASQTAGTADAERLMRLGLKAQAQCTRTLEVLGNLKMGPAVFARQANIAHGPQQVNNHAPPPHAGAGEVDSRQHGLAEVGSANYVDTGATSTSSGASTAAEAMAEVHRPTNR